MLLTISTTRTRLFNRQSFPLTLRDDFANLLDERQVVKILKLAYLGFLH